MLVFVQSTRYSRQISMNLAFSQQIFEKFSNFMKTLPVSADLFYEDGQTHTKGQTGMMKLKVPFRNFPNAHKNWFPKK